MRGAWIEIPKAFAADAMSRVAPPCGARGLKYLKPMDNNVVKLVAPPCGARGLKSDE